MTETSVFLFDKLGTKQPTWQLLVSRLSTCSFFSLFEWV